jgi:D-glycero-beta-D-manno-heptose-7-phosphate kinase
MIELAPERLNQLKNNFKGLKIAVIGDMMLDCYFRGDVKRISPEAPVPVIEVENEYFRFGGAANVALNILKLGGIPYTTGVVGNDNDGKIFNSLMKKSKIAPDGIVVDTARPTTAKTRVIAGNQHVVRIDKESKKSISSSIEKKLFEYLHSHIKNLDGIILQDYNKGVLTAGLIKKIIALANEKNILITVDPKFHNFFEFRNVSVFKPNRKEAEEVLGIKITTDEDISKTGHALLEKLNARTIMLTLGSEGIAVFEHGKPEKRMPTKARKVADVSGAGDTVIATLTMALAAGGNITEASYLANYAAGIVCQEVGIVPIELDTLFNIVGNDGR